MTKKQFWIIGVVMVSAFLVIGYVTHDKPEPVKQVSCTDQVVAELKANADMKRAISSALAENEAEDWLTDISKKK